jgi:DNA invertase Pin-like site-specific DNA recombinase
LERICHARRCPNSSAPSGLARAREKGTESGKPFGRPKTNTATEDAIRSALASGGKGIRKIAAELGVGTGTVQRIKAAAMASVWRAAK